MAKIENFENCKINIYSCGSQRLSHEIRIKLGMQPINTYKNEKGKIINVFILTPQLSEFLSEWTKNRPLKEKKKWK